MIGYVAQAGERSYPHAIRRKRDRGKSQAVDVNQSPGCGETELHQVEKIRASGDSHGAIGRGEVFERFLLCCRFDVGKRLHG